MCYTEKAPSADARVAAAQLGEGQADSMRLPRRKALHANHLSAAYSWRLAVTAILLAAIVGKALGSAGPAPLEQALAAVHDCIAGSPAPWPDTWQREYLDMIQRAVSAHPDAAQHSQRLAILAEGFQPYWAGLQKGQDRSLFDVHCAEIRWYTESLMGTGFRGEEDRHALRYQYQDLFHYAATSLLAQFPFLDPNAVQRAEADHLAECYRRIDAPLLPIYLEPFSQAQIDRIKQRWYDLRYARVDLWRQLGGNDAPRTRNPGFPSEQARPLKEHPDYLLTQRSLAQLQPHIWAVATTAPDYYRSALGNHLDAQKHRLELMVEARNQERRLPRAVLQAEQISFLLGALLETARSSTESSRAEADGNTAPAGLYRSAEGGGAHGRE